MHVSGRELAFRAGRDGDSLPLAGWCGSHEQWRRSQARQRVAQLTITLALSRQVDAPGLQKGQRYDLIIVIPVVCNLVLSGASMQAGNAPDWICRLVRIGGVLGEWRCQASTRSEPHISAFRWMWSDLWPNSAKKNSSECHRSPGGMDPVRNDVWATI